MTWLCLHTFQVQLVITGGKNALYCYWRVSIQTHWVTFYLAERAFAITHESCSLNAWYRKISHEIHLLFFRFCLHVLLVANMQVLLHITYFCLTVVGHECTFIRPNKTIVIILFLYIWYQTFAIVEVSQYIKVFLISQSAIIFFLDWSLKWFYLYYVLHCSNWTFAVEHCAFHMQD